MARRVAPNILNTLADPAEYELKLFYRGHEHIAAPAADDARPKLDSDSSLHGAPAHDANYKCIFWLDEHDHKAKADGQVANHQAKVNALAAAKITKTQKNDRVPPTKRDWEKAKSDHDGTVATLKDKKQALERAETALMDRDGDAYQQSKWVLRCIADVDEFDLKPKPLNANDTLQLGVRKQKLLDAQKELAKREKAQVDAAKARDTAKAEFEDAQREEQAAAQFEAEAKLAYDTAVKESADADKAEKDATAAATAADPVKIREQEVKDLHTNSAATCAAAEQTVVDEAAAEADAKNADQLDKDATAAENAAKEAEDAVPAAQERLKNAGNFVTKAIAKSALASATEEAENLRDLATKARERADKAKTKAEASQTKATASKNAEMNASKRAGDEPEPLAINTEILLADKTKKYRVLVTDNHGMKGRLHGNTRDSMNASKPAQYVANGWMRDVMAAVPLEAVVLKTSDKKQLTFGASDVRVVWEVIDPAENLAIIELFKGAGNPASGADRPKAWLTRMFADAGFQSPTLGPDSVNDNCPTTYGGVRPAAGGVTPAPSVLFKAPLSTASPAGLDAFAGIANSGASAVAPGKDKDGLPVGLSRVFFRPPPIGGDNYRFRISLVDADGNKVKFKNADGKTVEFIETGTFTVWRRLLIDFMVTFSSVDQATIDWHMTRDCYLPAYTQVIGPLLKKVYDKAAWERVVKAYFATEGSIPRSERNNAAHYAQGEYDLHLIPPYPKLLPSVVDPNPAKTAANSRYDFLNDGSRSDRGNAKLQLRWTHTEGLSKAFLDDAYTATGRINPRTAGDDYAQKTELPGLSVFFAKQPMEWSTVLGQYLMDREFQFVQVGDVTCTFAHELGHAVYITHAFTRFQEHSGILWTNNSQDEFQFSEHCQNDAVLCLMAYQNDYFGDDGQTVRADDPVPWRFCAACLLKLRFWDLAALRGNAQFMRWIHEGLGAAGNNSFDLVLSDLSPIPANATAAKNAVVQFHALSVAEATPNNEGGVVRKILSLYRAGAWAVDRGDLAAIDNNGKFTGSNVAAGGPPPDPRLVTYTYTLPTVGGNAKGTNSLTLDP